MQKLHHKCYFGTFYAKYNGPDVFNLKKNIYRLIFCIAMLK